MAEPSAGSLKVGRVARRGGEGAEGHMPAADGSGIMMHRGGVNWTEGASERGALTRRPGDDDAMPSATMDPARCHAGCEN